MSLRRSPKVVRAGYLTATALAAIACVGLASTASAATTIVYSENFGGPATTTSLAGTAPTIDNGTSPTWLSQYSSSTTSEFWTANGKVTGSVDSNNNGALEVAALNLTPVSGNIYTLSANLLPTGYIAGNNADDGFVSVGFISGSASVPPFFDGVGPWMLSDFNGTTSSPTNIVQGFFGPGTDNGYTVSPDPAALGDVSEVVLNTTQSQWVATEYYNGAETGNWAYAAGANPTGITDVAIGVNGMNGTVTNFSLTDQVVPEPASLGLLGIGAAGVLLLMKGRKPA